MNLKFDKIEDAGSQEKERIVFKVLANDQVGRYLVLKTKRGPGDSVSATNPLLTFWFDDKEVKKGDLVILYTKSGATKSKSNKTNKSHFFYWNQKLPILN